MNITYCSLKNTQKTPQNTHPHSVPHSSFTHPPIESWSPNVSSELHAPLLTPSVSGAWKRKVKRLFSTSFVLHPTPSPKKSIPNPPETPNTATSSRFSTPKDPLPKGPAPLRPEPHRGGASESEKTRWLALLAPSS